MRGRGARAGAVGVVLLAAGAAGLAQNAPPPKVALSFALEPGRVVRFLLRTESESMDKAMEDIERRAGMKHVERKTIVRTEFSVEVLKVLPDGRRSATIRFGRITATIPGIVGPAVEVSSDRPLEGDILSRMGAADAVAAGGLALPAILDARGTVLQLEVPEDARKAREKALGAREEDAVFFITALSPERLVDWVNRAWGAAPLPAKPVGTGDTWEARVPSSLVHPGGRVLEIRTFRVTGAAPAEVRAEGKGTVKVEPRKLPRELAALVGTVTVQKSSAACSVTLLPADGLPLSGKSEVSFTCQEKVEGAPPGSAMEIRAATSLERVEKWPSEAAAPPK